MGVSRCASVGVRRVLVPAEWLALAALVLWECWSSVCVCVCVCVCVMHEYARMPLRGVVKMTCVVAVPLHHHAAAAATETWHAISYAM